MGKILVCDDEEQLCRGLSRLLRGDGHEVVTADGPGGAAWIVQDHFDLILTDIRMPGVDGYEIIKTARRHVPHTPVIAMSGNAEIPDAVRAIHAGARDFLIKPFDKNALTEAMSAVFRPDEKTEEPVDPQVWRDRHAPWLLGDDPAMLAVLALLAQVADTRCTVLVTGESGTGKELAARSLHAGSSRAKRPFVAVNCAAIPVNLVESELFGHSRGAFTGATTARQGRFGQADTGTIFLDEIGEMDLNIQAKVLRLIQEGELSPVGDDAVHKVDVRVVAATNRNLEVEVAAGRFRADLFWRLNVIPLEMPPLQARPSDIVCLSEHFLRRANERNRRHVQGFSSQALSLMMGYAWPGNIRELENVVERMVIVKGSGTLLPSDLPAAIRTPRTTPVSGTATPQFPESGADLKTILEAVEEKMIGEALVRTGGNKNRAAELLGLNRTTLVEKLRRRRTANPQA
jgi:two-component system response regulator HydG